MPNLTICIWISPDTDQENWPEECSQDLQSPVDIQFSKASFHPTFPQLTVDTLPGGTNTLVSNNGKHIVIRRSGDLDVLGFVNGGPLFSQTSLFGIFEARFHFGILVDGLVMRGSDHHINGQSYAAEVRSCQKCFVGVLFCFHFCPCVAHFACFLVWLCQER